MKKRTMENGSPYLVPALERGMRILELLSEYPGGLQMTEMGALELPQASLYRMLITLSELGYLIREGNDVYRLGRKLLTLGYRMVDDSSLVEKAIGPMRELRDRTGETVMLGVLYGDDGVVIEAVKSSRAVCVSVRVGHHYPLHTAAPAKAMLAFLPDEERRGILKRIKYTKFTDATLAGAAELAAELTEIRQSGVAYDRGEEMEELRCAGSPILNPAGYPVAAVWIGGPVSRMDDSTLERFGVLVRGTAERIQERLNN